jgi:hypothetical protein
MSQSDRAQLRAETEQLFREPVVSQWSPSWAQHVVGYFGAFHGTEDEPQKYRCVCFICGAHHLGECKTGAVRNHVTHFAAAHFHKDPFR